MRVFVALDIPEDVKKQIVSIRAKLPNLKGKLTEPENLHLTLKFLDEVDEKQLEEIKKGLKKIKEEKFETVIDKIGFFDNSKPGQWEQQIVVWLHMTDCEELQKRVDDELKGLFKSEKRFMSHLTIARVKQVKDKREFLKAIGKINVEPIKFKVDKFKLKESILTKKGSIYKDLDVYNLL